LFRPDFRAGQMFSTLKIKLSYQNRSTLVSTFILVTIHQWHSLNVYDSAKMFRGNNVLIETRHTYCKTQPDLFPPYWSISGWKSNTPL